MMKKSIMLICIAITFTTTLEAKLKYKEKFTLIEYTSMGASNLMIEAIVEHNGKKCKRTYVSGYVSSEETNSCINKVGTTIVEKDGVEKSRYLEDYMQAYKSLTGKNQYKSGYSVIHAINSNNVEIYCTTDMKICKTRKEIYAVPAQ
jgi:hypothetical protein